MKKADLVLETQKSLPYNISKEHVRVVVDSVFASLTKGLQADGRAQIAGFGTFEIRSRKARVGRNPRTGEPITLAAARTVGFRPSSELKLALDDKPAVAAHASKAAPPAAEASAEM